MSIALAGPEQPAESGPRRIATDQPASFPESSKLRTIEPQTSKSMTLHSLHNYINPPPQISKAAADPQINPVRLHGKRRKTRQRLAWYGVTGVHLISSPRQAASDGRVGGLCSAGKPRPILLEKGEFHMSITTCHPHSHPTIGLHRSELAGVAAPDGTKICRVTWCLHTREQRGALIFPSPCLLYACQSFTFRPSCAVTEPCIFQAALPSSVLAVGAPQWRQT